MYGACQFKIVKFSNSRDVTARLSFREIANRKALSGWSTGNSNPLPVRLAITNFAAHLDLTDSAAALSFLFGFRCLSDYLVGGLSKIGVVR